MITFNKNDFDENTEDIINTINKIINKKGNEEEEEEGKKGEDNK